MDTPTASAKKPLLKKWWVWVLIVLGIFIIIGALGSSSTDDAGSTVSSQTVYKVGDQIKQGDTILTVTDVKRDWKSSNEFDKPSNSDNAYVLITVEIQNTGSDSLDLASMFDFKLQDGNGAIRNQSLGGVGIKSLSSIGAVASGGKASGQIIFEASKDALDTLVLRYDPAFSFAKEVAVELQ